MPIRLDAERYARKLRDKKRKNKWQSDAYEVILTELAVFEMHVRDLVLEGTVGNRKVDYLREYCAYCGVALLYAKQTPHMSQRQKLHEMVARAVDQMKKSVRITIDSRRTTKISAALPQFLEILDEFDALQK